MICSYLFHLDVNCNTVCKTYNISNLKMACAFPPESSSFDELITCPICLHPFDRGIHRAKVFPNPDCQHAFCEDCIKDIIAKDGSQIKCPFCQENITIPDGGAEQLQNSINVENLLDYRHRRESAVLCGNKHTFDVAAIRYCHQCGCFQCAKCVESHQIMTGLEHHRLISLREVEKYSATVKPVKGIAKVKFIVVGAMKTGKTAILRSFKGEPFQTEMQSTMGTDLVTAKLKTDNIVMRLEIWDSAGQEIYRSIGQSYYRDAAGALLVYDITSRKTYDDPTNGIRAHLTDINRHNPEMAIVLCGNKNDMEDREVSLEEAATFAQDNGLIFLETSAKTGENIEEAFTRCASKVARGIQTNEIRIRERDPEAIQLEIDEEPNGRRRKRKWYCCYLK